MQFLTEIPHDWIIDFFTTWAAYFHASAYNKSEEGSTVLKSNLASYFLCSVSFNTANAKTLPQGT